MSGDYSQLLITMTSVRKIFVLLSFRHGYDQDLLSFPARC